MTRPSRNPVWLGILLLPGLASFGSAVPVTNPGENATTAAPVPFGSGKNAWEVHPFNLMDLDGVPHGLTDWRGRVILLNFWASWCAPCQYEIREFVRYQEKWGPQGLQIVGIGLDEARKLSNVRRTLGINYPVLVADPTRESGLLKDWGNPSSAIPYTVVIDRSGEVRYTHRGPFGTETFEAFVLPLVDPGKTGPISQHTAAIR